MPSCRFGKLDRRTMRNRFEKGRPPVLAGFLSFLAVSARRTDSRRVGLSF